MNRPTDDDVAQVADLILTILDLDPKAPTRPTDHPCFDDWEDDITDFEDAIHNAIFTRIHFANVTKGD